MNIIAWGSMSDTETCDFCGSDDVVAYCDYNDEATPICKECIEDNKDIIKRDLIAEVFINISKERMDYLIKLGEEYIRKQNMKLEE